MAVHLQLDKPHSCFTNLDLITGKVILSIFTEETISAINVKLESESRTRLAAPVRGGPGGHRNRDRNTQLEIEVHKVSEYSRRTQIYVETALTGASALVQGPEGLSFFRALTTESQ